MPLNIQVQWLIAFHNHVTDKNARRTDKTLSLSSNSHDGRCSAVTCTDWNSLISKLGRKERQKTRQERNIWTRLCTLHRSHPHSGSFQYNKQSQLLLLGVPLRHLLIWQARQTADLIHSHNSDMATDCFTLVSAHAVQRAFQRMTIEMSTPEEYWATSWIIGGSSLGRGWKFFSSPPTPGRLWGPLSLLSNVYQGLFSWG
jgi:hypothetical protein